MTMTNESFTDKISASTEFVIELTESYTRHLGRDRHRNKDNYWDDRSDRNPQESCRMVENLIEIAIKEGATEDKQYQAFKHDVLHGDMGITESIWETIVLAFTAVGGTTAFINLGKELLLKWRDNMGGRSIKLKVGDIELEIKGDNDMEKALRLIKQLQKLRSDGTPPVVMRHTANPSTKSRRGAHKTTTAKARKKR